MLLHLKKALEKRIDGVFTKAAELSKRIIGIYQALLGGITTFTSFDYSSRSHIPFLNTIGSRRLVRGLRPNENY